jgi:hypothetical protein
MFGQGELRGVAGHSVQVALEIMQRGRRFALPLPTTGPATKGQLRKHGVTLPKAAKWGALWYCPVDRVISEPCKQPVAFRSPSRYAESAASAQLNPWWIIPLSRSDEKKFTQVSLSMCGGTRSGYAFYRWGSVILELGCPVSGQLSPE